MGIFDGVLLISDYDNTLVYSDSALRSGTAIPPVPVGAEREYLRPQSGREKECESKRRAAFHRVYRCFRPSTKRPIRSIASMISSALEA